MYIYTEYNETQTDKYSNQANCSLTYSSRRILL